jgi:hypothetical protein
MTTTSPADLYEGPKSCVYRVDCPQCRCPAMLSFTPTEAIVRQSCLHFKEVIVVGGHHVRVEFSS